jgi:hypothetical protein
LQVIEDTPASRKGKGGGGGRKRRDDGEIRSSDESGGEGGAPGTSGHKEGKKRSSKKAGGRVGKKTFFYLSSFANKKRNLVNNWRTFVDAKYFAKMSAFSRKCSIFVKIAKNCIFCHTDFANNLAT